jgi:uncharacterized membrane protein YhaH (DUF805 family)
MGWICRATANVPGNLTERPPGSVVPVAPTGPWQVFRRSFALTGRATRSELISYLFASLLLSVPLSFVTGLALTHVAHMLAGNAVTLLLALPVPALLVRRFHDSGRSGAWVWLAVLGFTIWLARTAISATWGMDARLSFDSWTWVIDWAVIMSNLASVLLALLPGTKGPNRYGTDPRV